MVAVVAIAVALWFLLRNDDPDYREVKMIADGLNTSSLTQRYAIDFDAKKLNVVLAPAAHASMFGPSDISTYLCDTFASQRSVDARQPQAKLRDDWELILKFEDGDVAAARGILAEHDAKFGPRERMAEFAARLKDA